MKSFKTENFTFIDFAEMDEDMSNKVWKCRNLPEIRKWMDNASPILLQDHLRFVESLKQEGNKKYFCIIYKGSFAGSINIHYKGQDSVERGIYLHPDFFGQNLAYKISMEFYSYIHKNTGIRYILTKVLKTNIRSNKLQTTLYAEKKDEDDLYNYYRLDLSKLCDNEP